MRAFVVEFAGADDRDTVAGRGARRDAATRCRSTAGIGQLAARTDRRPTADPDEGEPA